MLSFFCENMNKEEELVKCPKCKSISIARFYYGLPELTEDLKKKIENKEIVLGGCELSWDNPIYRCNVCSKEF